MTASSPEKKLDQLIAAAYALREKQRDAALKEKLNAAKTKKYI